MAEICFDCLNQKLGGNLNRKRFLYTKDLELCENCGRYKKAVIVERNRYYYLNKFKVVIILLSVAFLPITIIGLLIYRLSWRYKIIRKMEKK